MAKRMRDVPTRQDVTEKIDTSKEDMRGKEVDLDRIASDVETVRETLENLEFRGTAEGVDEVEESIRGAEDVTTEVFDHEDQELEDLQGENQEHENDLQEKSDSTESDLGKVKDASTKIETKETMNELIKAKEAAVRDIEFLSEQINRARDARDQSEQVQNDHQARVHSRS